MLFPVFYGDSLEDPSIELDDNATHVAAERQAIRGRFKKQKRSKIKYIAGLKFRSFRSITCEKARFFRGLRVGGKL
jgi:hypothetical protein